jgi:ATP-binding cassette subfamily C (CFTR/MRP) protein 1
VTTINILLVVIAIINRHTVNIGILAVAMSMAAQLCQELMVLVVEWTSTLSNGFELIVDVEMAITSVERIQEYINLPPQETRPVTGEEWLHHGSIRFSKLSARYRPDLPPAISKINFSVKVYCGDSSNLRTTVGKLWWMV